MRKKRFTDEKMVKILRDAEKTSVAAAAKKHGVSQATLYAWRSRVQRNEKDPPKGGSSSGAEGSRTPDL